MPTSHGRLGVIFLTVLIDLIGFGIILPVLPFYAKEFGANGLKFGLLVGSFSGMQFLATAILGRLSDRTGRRPILLATTLINAVGYTMLAFAPSYWLLLASRLVSGFGGGNISVAQAYVADITPPERRSKGMGMIGAAFGLGFIIGPALGGLAGHYWGHTAPGLVAAGLSVLNFGLAWRILRESLDHQHRVKRSLLDLGHIGDAFARPAMRPLMVVWFLVPFAFAGYTTVLPLHAAERFGWGEKELGWMFAIVGVVASLVQGWAFGRLVQSAGERALIIIGTLGMATTMAIIPLMPSSFALYAWTVPFAFTNSLFAPAATGMISLLASPSEQGTILGAAQALGALGRLSGPEAFGLVFDGPGAAAAFVGAGVVMLVSAAVAGRIHKQRGAGSGERVAGR